MKKQKFSTGDHVKVAKDLGSTMRHFQNDCEAIIIGSYADRFGGDDIEFVGSNTRSGRRLC